MSTRHVIHTLGSLAAACLCGCATPGPGPSDTGERAPQQAAAPTGQPGPAGGELAIAALTFLDRPYQAGGKNADTGFDCSGFTRYVYARAGIDLPPSTEEQARAPALRAVPSRSTLQPGDLVFFNTLQRTFSHVGIYLGDGRFIHAPRTGAQVRIESIQTAYWSQRYTGGRRATALEAPP